MKSAHKILIGNTEGKKPLEKLRLTWKDNIKMDLKGKGYEGVESIHLVQDKAQWRAEGGNKPSGSIKCWEFLDRFTDYQLLEKDAGPWSKLVLSQRFQTVIGDNRLLSSVKKSKRISVYFRCFEQSLRNFFPRGSTVLEGPWPPHI
jgi:hypothetical protein